MLKDDDYDDSCLYERNNTQQSIDIIHVTAGQ